MRKVVLASSSGPARASVSPAAQAVIEAGLIDEFRLPVDPVVLTDGKPLFNEPQRLQLIGAQRFDTGVVIHTYSRQ